MAEPLDPVGDWLAKGILLRSIPIWFFAIAAIANGIGHPVLAVVARGYFPGLITSPIVGVLGVLLWLRLQGLTRSSGISTLGPVTKYLHPAEVDEKKLTSLAPFRST